MISNRKLKLRKNFRPMLVDEGDELFPNGLFEFNVTKMLAFVAAKPDKFPVEQVDVSTLAGSNTNCLDQESVHAANLSNPIVLAEISPSRFNVVDGNHRLEKARQIGMKRILAWRIRSEQHCAFLTSEKAYNTYVRYWNEKLNEVVLADSSTESNEPLLAPCEGPSFQQAYPNTPIR